MRLPRIRFLLADDPGAGKTIMAGLLLKELKIRGLVKRTLIIAPANLCFQWQRELNDKTEGPANWSGAVEWVEKVLDSLKTLTKSGTVLRHAAQDTIPPYHSAVIPSTSMLSAGAAIAMRTYAPQSHHEPRARLWYKDSSSRRARANEGKRRQLPNRGVDRWRWLRRYAAGAVS